MSFMGKLFNFMFGAKLKAQKLKGNQTVIAPARRGALYMDTRLTPDTSQFPMFGLNIIDWKARWTRPANSGRVLAYYALGEIGPSEPWFGHPPVPVLGTNNDWGSKYVDLRDPRWADFLIEQLRESYLTEHWDGVFFDTGDTYWALDALVPGHLDEFIAATARVLNQVKAAFPAKMIVPNRSFAAFDQCRDALSGFLFEGLYYGFSGQKSAAGTLELLDLAAPIKAAGLPVYVIDYVKDGQETLAKEIAAKIRRHGFLPLVTTVDLEGKVLAS